MKRITIDQIDDAVKAATRKHGPMSKDKKEQVVFALEELGEMAQIANDLKNNVYEYKQRRELEEQYCIETLDTIAALVRIYEVLTGGI